jgi:peptidoglycan/LPS O-acetylase OafA/YrhL
VHVGAARADLVAPLDPVGAGTLKAVATTALGRTGTVEARRRARYLPALDGVRAIAIAAVVAYHLGLGWAGGGYLGVDLFFVLSGFLITSLLFEERAVNGVIRLRAFWGRRARRLLPGLLVMILALGAYVAATGTYGEVVQFRGDAIAAVFYFANWHLLFAHQSYFTQFQSPSPLAHTWSLSIEEQFYVVWPLALVAVLAVATRLRRRDTSGPRAVLAVAVAGAAASAAWMAALALGGASANRLYYGTDTRAFDLLVGVALAALLASRAGGRSALAAEAAPGSGHSERRAGTPAKRRAERALHLVGGLALGGLVTLYWRAGSPGAAAPPKWMFEGGFLAAAVLAALLIADVGREKSGPVGSILSLGPVRFLGRISYSLYLWHWPVIVECTPERLGFAGSELTAVRVGASLVLATASYYLVEQPLRHARYERLPKLARAAVAPVAMAGTAGVVLLTMAPALPAVAPPAAASTARTAPGAGHLVSRGLLLAPGPAEHPVRVLLIGDSVMQTDAPAVEAALDSTGIVHVTSVAFPGWGLSTDRTWRVNVPQQIARAKADVVIAMWSWDDNWLLADPVKYRRQLLDFVHVVLRPGDGVRLLVFQQFPEVGPVLSYAADAAAQDVERAQGITAWNALVASVARDDPRQVAYVPVGSAVLSDGSFTQWLPPEAEPNAPRSKWVRVRMVDNVHFCPAGAARYAAALAVDLHEMVGLPLPKAGWTAGSWAESPVYDTPAGSCPNDHP